jgi:hypothetical protein
MFKSIGFASVIVVAVTLIAPAHRLRFISSSVQGGGMSDGRARARNGSEHDGSHLKEVSCVTL